MPRQATIPQLNGITADCWLAEEHSREMEITENPIEFGAPITDHAFVKPQELVVEFGVTNTPLIDNFIFGTSGTDRIERAREILFKLQDDKVFLTVQTLTGGVYNRLLIQSINWRTDSKNPQSVTYALKLKEVKITQTKTTSYTPLPADKKVADQTSPTKKAGEKSSKKLATNSTNADSKKGNTASTSTSSEDKAKATAAKKQGNDIKEAKSRKKSIAATLLDNF